MLCRVSASIPFAALCFDGKSCDVICYKPESVSDITKCFNLVLRFVKSEGVTRVTNQWFSVKNFKREILASNDVKARH